MSMTIISCPSCDAMLLSDTVQCPTCKHVLQPDKYELHAQAIEAAERAAAAQKGETPCPACGEGLRPGMVRCFNCGTFVNNQTAESFEQIQASGLMENSVAPAMSLLEDAPLAPEDPAPAAGDDQETSFADDDDFEIAPEYALRAPSEDFGTYAIAWEHADSSEEIPIAPIPDLEPPAPIEPVAPEPGAVTPAVTQAVVPPRPPAAEAAVDAQPIVDAPIPDLDGPDHSVATAGDVLLKIALDEEQQAASRRGGRVATPRSSKRRGNRIPGPRSATGLIVFCPRGHRIEAQQKHRGMMGRCPKCKLPFFVPNLDLPPESATPAAESAPAPAEAATAAPTPAAATVTIAPGSKHWMSDVSLHNVNPTKVKAKPGCLAKSFAPVDVCLSSEGILVATLVKPGGLFGLGGKKPEPVREVVRTHMAEGKPLTELPAASHQMYAAATLASMTVTQPAAYAHESPFGDVLVFGEGRIAVKLPDNGDSPEKQFLSFPLSSFREFLSAAKSLFGLGNFGENCGIPLEDSSKEYACHYSDAKLQALNDVSYYKADPAYKLEIIGRKCAECGLIVSEDSRKKEKIGGADGKGIAKAKCPKCQKKFGSETLYALAKAGG